MSLELIATIICDNCPTRAPSAPANKFTEGNWFAGHHKQELMKRGWITVNRGSTEAHYCPECADKLVKPIPGKPRWKGPEVPDVICDAIQPPCLLPERLGIANPCNFIPGDVVLIQWHLKHSRKDQITGWISNESLTELLGQAAAT